MKTKRFCSFALSLVLVFASVSAAHAASDEGTQAADGLDELGLFQGTGIDPSGKPIYDLNRAPTRNEAVTMLVRLLGKEEEAVNGNWNIPFTDVADWVEPYVGYAYANGLTSGTSTTTYSGDVTVTAAQYLTFVLRALGYESGTDFQWDQAWELSDLIGLTDGSYGAQTTEFLRGDVAKISYRALVIEKKDTETMLISQLVEEGAVDARSVTAQGFDLYGLTDRVHFIYDIRTFTVYAFMNYTGYDDNNGYPITGVRKSLREDLAAMDLHLSEPEYFTKKDLEAYYYENALRNMGAAPNFGYLMEGGASPSLSDLPSKLREFYAAADIPTLYEKYRADYEAVAVQYQDSLPYIVKMVCYFADNESAQTKAEMIQKMNDDGFVMSKYVYDRIPEFERYDGTFDEFVQMLLAEYPQHA
jgi:hypothetical protein